jgi:hypothetical protein
MAISDGDVSLLQSAGASSSGGAITASGITSGVSNNLWPDVTSAERIAGGERFRKVFWKNSHATDAALKPVLYAPVLPTGATLSLGLGFNSADDDDPAQGSMTAFGAAAQVALISDGTDTRQVTVYGLNNAGSPVPTVETVTLTSAVEKLTTATFSKVYAVMAASEDASRTITVKQGSGGTTRGTIPVSRKCCWIWVAGPSSKAAGIALPDLAAGANYGLWLRLAWTAGASVVRPNTCTVTFEESA